MPAWLIRALRGAPNVCKQKHLTNEEEVLLSRSNFVQDGNGRDKGMEGLGGRRRDGSIDNRLFETEY
jgi:hypothetical protein